MSKAEQVRPSPAIRVLVDAISLSDSSQFRGIGTYTRELLRALGERGDVEVTALATPATELPPGIARVNIVRRAPGRWAAREHALLLPLDVARAVHAKRVDVVHSPSVQAPRWARRPVVQTVCDVPTPEGEGNLAALAASVQRADHVVCISEDTGKAAVSAFGLDASLMTVAPLGFNAAFAPGVTSSAERFLLFVGEYDPRKRHDLAIEAHNELLRRGIDVRLRFLGRVAPWFADEWADLLGKSVNPALVEVKGFVPISELVAAYRGAAAVMVTSDHEGFGLPALEAMACGAPVVAFSSGAAAEVIGDGGRLVSPGDLSGFVAAVDELLNNSSVRSDLTKLALARASHFSWRRCAELHVSAYRAAAGLGR